MDTLKNIIAFVKQLRNNEIDHGDIFSYYLLPVMSKSLVWWTEKDYKKTPKWVKVMYIILTIRLVAGMVLSLFYLSMHWADSKAVSMMLEDAALSMAGFVGGVAAIIFPFYRNRTSVLLTTINEINLNNLKRDQQENRRTSNRLFLILFLLCTLFEVFGMMAYLIFIWDFANSGLPRFNNFFYEPHPYSVMACLDEMSFWIVGVWVTHLANFYPCMYIDFILRISFHFRVTANEIRQLRSGVKVDEDVELEKLKSLIKDLSLLYWCVDEFNETIRIYIILWFWLIFSTLGVYAAVILSMGSILESWHLFFFPLYLCSLTVSFCFIGQHLKNSADEVRVGISECDWYSAPIPFRKLVVNVLIRCTHETLFRASPFYDVDLLLLTRVLKTTYSLIAVFGNSFN